MTYLKRLSAAVVLTLVVGLSAFADCPQPAPGIMDTPPCIPATQTAPDDSAAPGQMEAPPASDSVDLISVAEIALNSLLLF
jgi:hypothetical protein